jgi:glycyl-tRNA synthetase beta subunit
MASMQPEFDDEEPINPFDFWKGANFKLKLVKKDGYWNYDKSEFASSSALLDDDDELETIYKSLNNLNDFVSPSEFKSYEDLKKRLGYVLGLKGTPKKQDPETIDEEEEISYDDSSSKTSSSVSSSSDDEDEEDPMSYFSKLAEM